MTSIKQFFIEYDGGVEEIALTVKLGKSDKRAVDLLLHMADLEDGSLTIGEIETILFNALWWIRTFGGAVNKDEADDAKTS